MEVIHRSERERTSARINQMPTELLGGHTDSAPDPSGTASPRGEDVPAVPSRCLDYGLLRQTPQSLVLKTRSDTRSETAWGPLPRPRSSTVPLLPTRLHAQVRVPVATYVPEPTCTPTTHRPSSKADLGTILGVIADGEEGVVGATEPPGAPGVRAGGVEEEGFGAGLKDPPAPIPSVPMRATR